MKKRYCPKCDKDVEVRNTGCRYNCTICGEWCRGVPKNER